MKTTRTVYLPEGDWWWWWRGVFLPSRCGLSIFLKGVVMVRTQEPMTTVQSAATAARC
jgi:hypothetical protein